QLCAQLSKLPLELMSEILVHVNYSKDNHFAFQGAPLVSQVCHSWREIALGEPRLW
ncbi:hypothetical protein DFH06DRAFT_901537, partial [Mycena polygramma]